ncbi:L,D-transpeptidase family protein [Longimicrobium sp.]|uniref:L,D-transpeptidase family protein n=1 Tax=Longimicrobium sp. TaxID=2029185 RepID=UPI003B3BCEFE
MRAARAALVVFALVSAPAVAQQTPGQGTPTARPAALPPMRAQPPARRPAAQPAARPATQPAQRPAATRPRPSAPPVAATATARADSGNAGPAPERWAEISVATANSGAYKLPVGRGHQGPSVLHVQVLLNRALFSPGMLDARWGRNTATAVQWFQARESLPATGVVDSATYIRLTAAAGGDSLPTIRQHVLTAEEVAGPFVQIPTDIYAHARLRCSCYESLTEKLTETFASSAELLRKLNPGMTLDSLAAGDTLFVPALRDANAAPAGVVKQIVVSGTGNYLQALDSAGTILYHFAATLGSSYDPSPAGDFRVTSIHPDPWWNYQPKLLAHVPDDRPNALIPPGPNSSVGKVWMALSAPHYGIHGTKSPETIGYAQSAGCVRLTNWDAIFLSKRLTPGTPVAFRGTRDGAEPPVATTPRPTAQPAAPAVARDSTRRDSVAAQRPATTAPARPAADTVRARPASAPQPAADTARARPAATPGPATPAASRPAADSARARPASTPRPASPAPRAPASSDSTRGRPRG